MEEEDNNIRVVVRVRPVNDHPTICVHADTKNNVVFVDSKPKAKQFSYDYVGGPNSTQRDFFIHVGKGITDRCLDGYNGTIFAYGQTGSGKTV